MNNSTVSVLIATLFSLGLVSGSVYVANSYRTDGNRQNPKAISPAQMPDANDTPVQNSVSSNGAYAYPSPLPVEPVDIAENGNPALGDPDAPIYIVEYTDYECPNSAEFHQKYFPRIKKEYIDTGKMRYVIKDFPLKGHRRAPLAANVANCVYLLNGDETFFDFITKMFIDQDDWLMQDNVLYALSEYALDFDVDVTALRTCYVEKRAADNIATDVAEGESFGVNGTPIFFVNGKPLIGLAPTYEGFVEALEKILSE